MRVTFDTNVLDYACRPERYPKDPRQPNLQKVRDALSSGVITGYYSATMLTIEGIGKIDRSTVFSGTRLKPQSETTTTTKNADLPDAVRAKVGDEDVETIGLTLVVNQPDRKPLHPEVIARATAAHSLGLRLLKSPPRIGAFEFTDLQKEFYLDNGQGEILKEWIEKVFEVGRAIEARNVGFAQLKTLGQSIGGPGIPWFKALIQAKDVHQQRAIERAFAEWADADSVASHVAYGIDVFCSGDVGKSNATNSVLDANNRAWLTATYGVKFMTFDELLGFIDRPS